MYLRVSQKSKAARAASMLSSPVSEYTPRSDTSSFRPSLHTKALREGRMQRSTNRLRDP